MSRHRLSGLKPGDLVVMKRGGIAPEDAGIRTVARVTQTQVILERTATKPAIRYGPRVHWAQSLSRTTMWIDRIATAKDIAKWRGIPV